MGFCLEPVGLPGFPQLNHLVFSKKAKLLFKASFVAAFGHFAVEITFFGNASSGCRPPALAK